jgi:hypothetical protein
MPTQVAATPSGTLSSFPVRDQEQVDGLLLVQDDVLSAPYINKLYLCVDSPLLDAPEELWSLPFSRNS